MTNQLKDWFVKSSYWLNWSRSLQRMGGDYRSAVDISITPINRDIESEWNLIKLIKVRRHFTPETPLNFSHHLSMNVTELMLEHMSEVTRDHILNFDFFNSLDPIKLIRLEQKVLGGGIPMALLDYRREPNQLTAGLFKQYGGDFAELKQYHDKLFDKEQNLIEVGRGVPHIPKGVYRYYGKDYTDIDISRTNGKVYIGHKVVNNDIVYMSPLRNYKTKDGLLGIRKVYVLFVVNNCIDQVKIIQI